jgi:hypothetical protein
MLVRKLSKLLTASFLAVAFVSLAGVAGGSVAKAQGRYRDYYPNSYQWRQREALRRHQLRERFRYGDSCDLRRHQQREQYTLRRNQRFDRFRFNDGYGRFPIYRRRY